jgi:two-component system alkaline phosphatase synthesis response regulator PhoP
MKKKVLVVDDEPQVIRLITYFLKANNLDVISAKDGYQCWHIAKLELPDLILLDIKMPLGGGINTFKLLKGTPETSLIPIIFTTAYPSSEVKKQLLNLGADDFISKPFAREVVMKKINILLKHTANNSEDKSLDKVFYNQNSL